MLNDIKNQLRFFRKKLKESSSKERAVNEKKYLKSPYKFFGVSLPETERIAKEFRKSNQTAEKELVIELAKRLWDSEYHDEKRLGLRILQYYPGYLDFSVVPLLEEMLMESTDWDLVDDISIHLVGIEEKEFFIRKAIGWGLREMSKTDPEGVFDFLMKVKDKASGLTLREGSKRLSEKQKTVLQFKYNCSKNQK